MLQAETFTPSTEKQVLAGRTLKAALFPSLPPAIGAILPSQNRFPPVDIFHLVPA